MSKVYTEDLFSQNTFDEDLTYTEFLKINPGK